MAQRHTADEDRFVATSLEMLNWAQRNTRALVLGGAALAIVVFGVRYYFDYQKQVREAASTELRAVRMEMESGNVAQVTDRLRRFLLQFEGSEYDREARVLLAHALLLQNRAQEAIAPARQAMKGMGKEPLANRAAFLLAAAYEEVGDTAAAIQVYEQIGLNADNRVQRSRGLEGAARLRAARGDRLGAAALYDRLLALTPEEVPARAVYEMRAAELRAEGLRPDEQVSLGG